MKFFFPKLSSISKVGFKAADGFSLVVVKRFDKAGKKKIKVTKVRNSKIVYEYIGFLYIYQYKISQQHHEKLTHPIW